MNRRSVLSLLGLGSAGVLTAKGTKSGLHPARGFNEKALPFKPVQVALPVNSDGLDAVEQQNNYKTSGKVFSPREKQKTKLL